MPAPIDVTCRVAAPTAEIMVRDDGRGLGAGRPDSYGLAIMRERAGLIDADLAIEAVEPQRDRGDGAGAVETRERLPHQRRTT